MKQILLGAETDTQALFTFDDTKSLRDIRCRLATRKRRRDEGIIRFTNKQ